MAEIKTDLNHKYKDRDPLETIKIIKDFFKQHDLIVIEEIIDKSESETYWCHVELYYKMFPITRANGKGVTKEYALASGYSELYERFCGGYETINVDFTYRKKLYELNYQKNNFYLHPNEQFASFDEIKNCCPKFKDFFSLLNDSENSYLKYVSLMEGQIDTNKILTIPFQDFNDSSKIKYFNQYILNAICGTDGLAAGNTIEEALIQALSECYEHHVAYLFYNNPQNIYYQINLSSLSLSQYLKDIINNIEKNNKLYIFDMSYNFKLPVVLGVIVNNITHKYHINIGSAPVFEIALERVLTEFYQGMRTYDDFLLNGSIEPRRGKNYQDCLYTNLSVCNLRTVLTEELFLNKTIINTYNSTYFLPSKTYSNIELINHFKNINKINNMNVYFYDISLSDQIKAVRVFIDNGFIFDFSTLYNFCKFKLEERNTFFKIAFQIFKEYNYFLDNSKKFNFNNLKNYLLEYQKIKNVTFNNKNVLDIMVSSNAFNFLFCDISSPFNLLQSKNEKIQEAPSINYSSTYISQYFYSLYLYKYNNNYTIKEIKNIFQILNSNNLTIINDYDNIDDINFLINKLILHPYYFMYHDLDFDNFIKIYVK